MTQLKVLRLQQELLGLLILLREFPLQLGLLQEQAMQPVTG